MKLAYAIIVLFAGAFAGATLVATPHDGDYRWQRWLGSTILHAGRIPDALHAETFSAQNAPWTAHEWAFSIAAALAGTAQGFTWFAAGSALCALLTLVLVGERARRRGASPIAVATVTALCGIAILESFGVRAQVIAWPLFALVLFLLDFEDGRAWCAIPIVALWANLHASVVIAPVFAAFTAAGAAANGDRRTALRRAGLFAGMLGAVCCNPFGWHLVTYAIGVSGAPMRADIREWQPAALDEASLLFGSLPLALMGGFAGRAFQRRPADAVGFLVALALMLTAARNIATFAIVAAPLVAPVIDAGLRRLSEPNARDVVLERLAGTLGVIAASGLIVLLAQPPAHPNYDPPRAAIAALDRTPGRHHLLCADFAWCSEALGSARTAVYLDGRCDPYPAAVWSDFETIVRLRPGWRRRLAGRRVDAIVAERTAHLAPALAHDHAWKQLYSDRRYVLFVRRNG